MPIEVKAAIREVTLDEFREVVFEAMKVFFAVHNEIGRLFDEAVYKKIVASRHGCVHTEVPIDVIFESFRKRYYLDMLFCGCAPFEVKACRSLLPEHFAQLINYLFLTGLPHGKLLNVRAPLVEHQFVNAPATYEERTQFSVDESEWQPMWQGDVIWKEWFTEAVRDWGTELELPLYVDAVAHILGGVERVEQQVDVTWQEQVMGSQYVQLAGPTAALRVTACRRDVEPMRKHLRRLLDHTRLKAVQWVNVTRHQLTFRTIVRRAVAS